jgi:hypothetical protein
VLGVLREQGALRHGAPSYTLDPEPRLPSSTAQPSLRVPRPAFACDAPGTRLAKLLGPLPQLLHPTKRLALHPKPALLISLQGSMEGVKLSQCDFVAVAHGVYAEHCLQMNVNNSHINATHCCIYACNVNQSSFSNLLLYKVAAGPASCSCQCRVRRRSDCRNTVHAALHGKQTVLMALVHLMTICPGCAAADGRVLRWRRHPGDAPPAVAIDQASS